MKFTPSILVALASLSIGEVAARRSRGFGSASTNSSSSAAVASSASTSAAAAVAAAGTSSAAASAATDSPNCLSGKALQGASASTGGAAVEAGQSNSATDPNNFINFCTTAAGNPTNTLTNGTQAAGGSCNGIVMGTIPASNKMISSVINFPSGQNDNIAANTAFTVKVTTSNLAAGVFTNPQTTYYAAPQGVDGNGIIIGHTHVTIQDTGGSLPTSPMDPTTFAFFKGINTPVDANGQLTADVTAGLPAGLYRICTMSSAANHQPVLMPIAQRGAQDDCRYFSVGGVGAGSGTGAVAAAGGAASSAASSAAAAATSSAAGAGAAAASTSSAAAGATTATPSSTSKNHRGRFGRGRGRFMARAYVA